MAYSAFPFAFTHRSPPAWLPSSHKADIQRLPWPFSSTWTNSQIACMPHAKSHLHLPSEPSIPFAHASSRLLHGHCPQTTITLNCLASIGPYHHTVHAELQLLPAVLELTAPACILRRPPPYAQKIRSVPVPAEQPLLACFLHAPADHISSSFPDKDPSYSLLRFSLEHALPTSYHVGEKSSQRGGL